MTAEFAFLQHSKIDGDSSKSPLRRTSLKMLQVTLHYDVADVISADRLPTVINASLLLLILVCNVKLTSFRPLQVDCST